MQKFLLACILFLFTLPLFAENTILILGDSLSASYDMDPQLSWVALLKKRIAEYNLGYQVINLSVTGSTTSDGLAELPKALDQYHPQITIIELGGNDGLRGLPLVVIKKNLQDLITLSKNNQSKVLLVGVRLPPNYGESYTQQFQQIFIDLSKENKISVVPLLLKGADDNPALMNADRIHPTAQAETILLDNVWEKLKDMMD